MTERYINYDVDTLTKFQQRLNDRINASPKYLGDNVDVSTTGACGDAVDYNLTHPDKVASDFIITLSLKDGGLVTIASHRYIHINDYTLNFNQLCFVKDLVDELAEFENQFDYIEL